MTYKSIHNYARIAPSKVRRVAVTMVGRSYSEAMAYLRYLPHSGAKYIRAVAHTAANALSSNSQLDESSLVLTAITVNEGPRMKRMWARARGRADVLLKRFSHITVELSDSVDKITKRNKRKKGVR